jgi:hypothetical protein
MTEARPCLRPAKHMCRHSPDLTNMVFGNLRVIGVGKRTRSAKPTWDCMDKIRRVRRDVVTASLTTGCSRGIKAPFGAGSLDTHGYRVITYNGKRVLEHRHVMAQFLGRPLKPNEDVHHGINGRACNDLTNLSIQLKGNHSRGHSEQELAEWLRSLGWGITPPNRLERKQS